MISEAALAELKLRNPCDQIARQWVTLRRHGKKYIGPCPLHSPDPAARDSTSFECDADGFVCAVCNDGGDVVRLVMKREGVDFLRAVELLGGITEPDAERAAELEREQQRRKNKREQEANTFRERERRAAFDIWHRGANWRGTPVEEYLRRCRGLELLPDGLVLRYAPQVAYFHGEMIDEAGRRSPRVIWRGPAMLAPIVDAGGKFRAVHCTWLDLESDGGKGEIKDPGGSGKLPSKKVRGSKAGNVIRLAEPLRGNPAAAEASAGDPAPLTLFVGEGIETVLSVWCGLSREGVYLSRAIFRSAVDLGNLAGKSLESVPHPSLVDGRGRVRRVPGPQPDLTAPGIDIPADIERLVLLGDGDSDPYNTRMALARASARYARSGLTIVGAFAPAGEDFNNVLKNRQPIGPIIEAAEPIGAPEIPRHAPRAGRNTRRKGRTDQLSAAAPAAQSVGDPVPFGTTQIADGAVSVTAAVSGAPFSDNASTVAAAEGAAPIVGDDNVVDFPQTSKKGSAGKPRVTREHGEGGDEEPPSGDRPPPTNGRDDDLDLRLAFIPHTDLGNAERFCERNRGKFLWCSALGWLRWDGKRWSRAEADERVREAVHLTMRAIQKEAAALHRSGRDFPVPSGKGSVMMSDKLAQWGRKSETASKIRSLADDVKPYLLVLLDQLDADPFKFNVANGTLVFHYPRAARRAAPDDADYVAFKPHDPADLITKCSRVVYDPAAACPVFDAALQLWQPSAEARRFLLAWQGVSLTGDVSDQKLCVFWGGGKNGKSSFIDAVAHVAGDYSETVPIETFLNEGRGRNAGQATPDLAILPGVRHLRTSEPDKGAKLAEALIKLTTGGEPILARHLNRDYFKFYPQFKLTISGNYRPSISGADEGIWRRVLLVPWTVTVPEEQRDPQLVGKLRAEASGILNRLLDGLRDWLDHGLVAPESVREATADYRRDSDPLGRFIADCTAPSPGDHVQSSVLYELFRAWAKANGEREWSNKGMSAALKERKFVAAKYGVMRFLDVKMTRTVDDFVDPDGRPRRADVAAAADPAAKQRADDDVVDF